MAQRDVRTFVQPLCEALATEFQLELVDVELVKEGPGWYLRIYINKDGGVTLEDCEKYHRAVQPRLEPVDYDFLEVSSPGLDRPLKMDRDFEKALGNEIEVRLYKPLDGVKAFNGRLSAFNAETITILTQAGEHVIARKDAALIKPVIIFEDDEGET